MPIWASIFAVIFLKESINIQKSIFLFLGLVGTWIILDPNQNSFNNSAIIVLLAAISYAIAHNLTKTLTKSDKIISILFWMSLIQLPLSILGAVLYGGIKIPEIVNMPTIVIFSVASLLAHFCLANALKLGDATFVLPLDYLRLPAIIILGWYLYNETVNMHIIIGSVLIIGSSLITLKKK